MNCKERQFRKYYLFLCIRPNSYSAKTAPFIYKLINYNEFLDIIWTPLAAAIFFFFQFIKLLNLLKVKINFEKIDFNKHNNLKRTWDFDEKFF